MNERFTPTTEQVRSYYANGQIDGSDPDCPVRAEFDRWLAERDRQVAEKAWDRCVGEMPIDPDWKNFYTDNNPYRKEES